MSDTLFHIRDLTCSYDDGNTIVLKIDELIIPRGKLIIILGKSGAGKSTILETLGLMNQTIQQGSIMFYPENGCSFDYSDLWTSEARLSDIRNEHMSFIFQNTNLMPNFTAYENAYIPLLLQGNDIKSAHKKVAEIMKLLGLESIKADTPVYEISGGQRQRLAFVRAIAPDFTVLFGDEPTGNLDEINSVELMKIIRSQLRQKKFSAILVTHNISLATTFADMIIILTKRKGVGEVQSENILTRKNETDKMRWVDQVGNIYSDVWNLLLDKLL